MNAYLKDLRYFRSKLTNFKECESSKADEIDDLKEKINNTREALIGHNINLEKAQKDKKKYYTLIKKMQNCHAKMRLETLFSVLGEIILILSIFMGVGIVPVVLLSFVNLFFYSFVNKNETQHIKKYKSKTKNMSIKSINADIQYFQNEIVGNKMTLASLEEKLNELVLEVEKIREQIRDIEREYNYISDNYNFALANCSVDNKIKDKVINEMYFKNFEKMYKSLTKSSVKK